MTTTIPYLYVSDSNPMQTVDSTLRHLSAFAGLFDVKTPQTFASNLDFSSGGTLTAPFYRDDSNIVNVGTYTLEFDQNESAADWFWMVCREPDSGIAYYVGASTSRHPLIYYYNGTSVITAYYMPDISIAQYAHIRLSVRKTIFGSAVERVWLAVSMWADDTLILTYFVLLPFSPNATTEMGPARYNAGGGGNRIYSNLSMAAMSDVIDSITIDPNEPAFPAFQRATEGYYLRYFMRGTNEVTFLKPKTQDTQMTLAATRSDPGVVMRNQHGVKSHIRLIGAVTQAEYVGTDVLYRFAEVNNPFLMTREDCATEAEAVYHRLKSEAETLSVSHPVNPVLELEDRITTPEGDWIISSINLHVNNMYIRQDITGRKYIYG
jgi:hypothetical protein